MFHPSHSLVEEAQKQKHMYVSPLSYTPLVFGTQCYVMLHQIEIQNKYHDDTFLFFFFSGIMMWDSMCLSLTHLHTASKPE